MAVRTFYGTCATASGVPEKNVIVPDIDLSEENFQIEEGDLLVVFFVDTNTEPTPSIVINKQDTETEISTTIDSGKLIKSLDVTANMENAWAAGETVIFAYTQQSTSDTYYWELIDANHASVETYGDTKLFDEENLNDLLAGTYDGEEDIALTPITLKKFFDLLKANEPEEEEPIGLKWTPAVEGEQSLGTLSLTNDMNGVDITYPLDMAIESYINDRLPQVITCTGQLINNGNGDKPDHGDDKTTEPFITRIIPDNLYFSKDYGLYYGTPSAEGEPATSWPRIIVNGEDNESNYIILGDSEDNTLSGIIINKPTKINGNLNVDGVIASTLPTEAGATTTIEPGIITNGTIKEQNQLLSERYSPKLWVKKYSDDVGQIEANKVCKRNNSSHLHIDVHQDGWNPIGIVGYNTNYKPPHNTGDALYANIWECYLTTINGVPNIEYSILNLRDKDIYITIDIYVLYEKVL